MIEIYNLCFRMSREQSAVDQVKDRFASRHRPNPRGLFFTFKGVGLKCGYLEGVITEDFFKSKYDEIQQRQIEIHAEIEGLRKRNSKYFEEGLEIFELMKNLKNQYVKADPAQKNRIMKILVSKWELKGINTIIYWNKPFDILFEMGQTQKWGG